MAGAKPARRWALRATSYFVLGAIANCAVAWSCGLYSSFESDAVRVATALQQTSDTHNRIWIYRSEAPGVQVLRVTKMIESPEQVLGPAPPLGQVWPWWIEYDDLWIAQTRHGPTDGVSGQGVIMSEVIAQGWPLPSLWCELHEYRECYGGKFFRHEQVPRTFMSVPRALAFRPLWSGMVVNSFVYAAAGWLLISFPMALRRYHRKRRNLCPACAYPIGASSRCTECGSPVPRVRPVSK